MNNTLSENKIEFETMFTDVTDKNNIKVCFVCTGNTCRSPMAAAVLNHLGKNHGYSAISAGLYPIPGTTISKYAVDALTEAGIAETSNNPYTGHMATAVTSDILSSCDKIIGITEAHTLNLIGAFPMFASKILTMPKDISDPYGGDLDDYKKTLCDITEGIKELFKLD